MDNLSHFIAYAIFGILTTIVNIVSYHISYSLLSIPNVPSTILAWTLAVIFAFITNKLWVFDSPSFSKQTLLHEIPTFLGARVSTGILDVLIMYVAVDIMAWPSLLWKCVSNVIVIVLNYVASKLLIFTKTGAKRMNHFFYPSLRDDAGAYYPGFFVITLNQQFDGSINPANFTDEQFATFVHEYTHYLQDISTTRGVYTFTHFSKLIQLNFHIIATMPDNVVQLPLKPEELNIDELNLEKSYIESLEREIELYKFYEGYDSNKKIHHVNRIKRELEDCFEYVTEEMYNINIYYDDIDIPFVLGQRAITESMAYTVEREAFGAKKRTKELPYNACEMICEKECPQLLANKAVFVAAMELSLMHYHSGDMFWQIVMCIKDNDLQFNSVNEFEKYFNQRTYFLYENMLKAYKEAMECVDFLYPDNSPNAKELFGNARSFEQDKLRRGTGSRIDYIHMGNFFIAKMLESENPRQLFNHYINYFGLPITCDSKYGMYGTKDDGNITALLAPLALHDMFEGNTNECSLYPYCKASNMVQCNKNECKKHPWTQADKDETCIFGAYWHMYRLTGKRIVRKA